MAGTILAVWHDRIVQPEDKLIRENNLYPNLLAIAERSWLGGGYQYFDKNGTMLPIDPDNEEHKAFVDFERRMLWHKEHHFQGYPFAYVKQTNVRWRITDPFPNDGELTRSFPPEKALQTQYTYEGKATARTTPSVPESTCAMSGDRWFPVSIRTRSRIIPLTHGLGSIRPRRKT